MPIILLFEEYFISYVHLSNWETFYSSNSLPDVHLLITSKKVPLKVLRRTNCHCPLCATAALGRSQLLGITGSKLTNQDKHKTVRIVYNLLELPCFLQHKTYIDYKKQLPLFSMFSGTGGCHGYLFSTYLHDCSCVSCIPGAV